MVRLAIPTTGSTLTTRFGQCDSYLFVSVDVEKGKVLDSHIAVAPPHAPDHLPDWIVKQGADVVLVPSVPGEFRTMLEFHGLAVIEHTLEAEPDKLIKSYLDGSLTALAQASSD